MEIKGLSDLAKYQGQFIRLSGSKESSDMIGYLDKTISAGRHRLVLFFFPIRKSDGLKIDSIKLADKALKERSIQVKKLNPLELLDLKIKLESKEIVLTDHSEAEVLALLNKPESISKL